MFLKRSAIALFLLPAFMACSDGVGPAPSMDQQAPNHLTWDSPPQFSVGGSGMADNDVQGDDPVLPGFAASSSDGSAYLYSVSFWAVRGADRGVMIYYRKSSEDAWKPYERFVVPAAALAYRPDGSAIATGDSVLITMTIDLAQMVTTYGPSGLQFSNGTPASLQKWYTGASGDFNLDGKIDEKDTYIEKSLLDLWTVSNGTPWTSTKAEHSITERWFKTWPEHFSGYAVSW
ncbi:MAG: hypothetical protein OEY20_01535 [Gemmatimonadota bacterium]|nr:hypothetical protein [Gemmatimonadota bacterium]MDH4350703.1 hypothetical protein [Gemmatimonadota bacterium]MDH5195914.1 hypothetical protein [Gemmatimonadota bacterium]